MQKYFRDLINLTNSVFNKVSTTNHWKRRIFNKWTRKIDGEIVITVLKGSINLVKLKPKENCHKILVSIWFILE